MNEIEIIGLLRLERRFNAFSFHVREVDAAEEGMILNVGVVGVGGATQAFSWILI